MWNRFLERIAWRQINEAYNAGWCDAEADLISQEQLDGAYYAGLRDGAAREYERSQHA